MSSDLVGAAGAVGEVWLDLDLPPLGADDVVGSPGSHNCLSAYSCYFLITLPRKPPPPCPQSLPTNKHFRMALTRQESPANSEHQTHDGRIRRWIVKLKSIYRSVKLTYNNRHSQRGNQTNSDLPGSSKTQAARVLPQTSKDQANNTLPVTPTKQTYSSLLDVSIDSGPPLRTRYLEPKDRPKSEGRWSSLSRSPHKPV